MEKTDLAVMGSKYFEDLKKVNEHGAEYWSARELQPLPGYSQWRRVEESIQRARTSCSKSGNDPTYHFADVGKMIDIGLVSTRGVLNIICLIHEIRYYRVDFCLVPG